MIHDKLIFHHNFLSIYLFILFLNLATKLDSEEPTKLICAYDISLMTVQRKLLHTAQLMIKQFGTFAKLIHCTSVLTQ